MSYSSEVLADSPLLYIRFEETAGATCANDGSLAGSATAAGTFTRNIATGLAGLSIGIDLASASGRATYPDDASLDITGDVTYECWFNADILKTSNILSKGLTGASAGYMVQLRVDGTTRILRADGGAIMLAGTGTYSASAWTHYAFTRSGNSYKVYLNGTNTDNATSATAINATSEAFVIGGNSNAGVVSGSFDGKMDEVAVYSTVLSPTRISAHYAARNTGGAAAPTFVPQIQAVY